MTHSNNTTTTENELREIFARFCDRLSADELMMLIRHYEERESAGKSKTFEETLKTTDLRYQIADSMRRAQRISEKCTSELFDISHRLADLVEEIARIDRPDSDTMALLFNPLEIEQLYRVWFDERPPVDEEPSSKQILNPDHTMEKAQPRFSLDGLAVFANLFATMQPSELNTVMYYLTGRMAMNDAPNEQEKRVIFWRTVIITSSESGREALLKYIGKENASQVTYEDVVKLESLAELKPAESNLTPLEAEQKASEKKAQANNSK